MHTDAAPIAAIDIGGTKIAAALVSSGGRLLTRTQRPTPAASDGETVLGAVLDALDELATAPGWSEVRALGVGSAGPVDISRGTVSPVNIPGWRGFPITERLSAHPAAKGLPVVLAGDGIAIAAAEHRFGAAQPYDNALCMVVSTGVGGGLILNGELHTGPTGNAGHIGHITVDLNGEPCPCGSRGCVEQLASGTAIARYALRSGWRPAAQDASAVAVAASARAGDPIALAAYERAGQALAAAIAATATLVELDAVVIGGGVAQVGDLLLDPLRAHLRTYAALPFAAGITVHRALLGTDAGLVGAAAVAMGA
ncbi:ROK family protein [Saccharothrix sp. ST-888]|uniref:ROK family protein n=1 Tax=Saccharothrix sp. ST-888 TaxID=1427391 RepID=UPI0005ECF083|nr:ROK family protein [Saccharothrix sp. ST-888]KJK58588.1 ROK family transcriptional regulator [Saccharothrix sp. ST-888]